MNIWTYFYNLWDTNFLISSLDFVTFSFSSQISHSSTVFFTSIVFFFFEFFFFFFFYSFSSYLFFFFFSSFYFYHLSFSYFSLYCFPHSFRHLVIFWLPIIFISVFLVNKSFNFLQLESLLSCKLWIYNQSYYTTIQQCFHYYSFLY